MTAAEIKKTRVGYQLYCVWCTHKRDGRSPEWSEFMPFYNWAMDHGFTDRHFITRRDKGKPFGPDNCAVRLSENGGITLARAADWDRMAAGLWALLGRPDPRESERLGREVLE